jgi:hypothetical protein
VRLATAAEQCVDDSFRNLHLKTDLERTRIHCSGFAIVRVALLVTSAIADIGTVDAAAAGDHYAERGW